LIEIGGSFRMPDVIAQSGARLREVGATNKTRLADYEAAIGPETAVVLKSHTSNFRIVGFTAQASRRELAELAHSKGVVMVEDLGSGVLVDLSRFGLVDEPVVRDVLQEGVDLVTFSGDKLLGGPQCGVIAGRATLVGKLRSHPIVRAMRIDKLSLAALEATLRLYQAAERSIEKSTGSARPGGKPGDREGESRKVGPVYCGCSRAHGRGRGEYRLCGRRSAAAAGSPEFCGGSEHAIAFSRGYGKSRANR